MINPPILYLLKTGGRFNLYCDSSRTHTGSSLWQVQEGKPRLIGYASKSLPAPALHYSVTELENDWNGCKHPPVEALVAQSGISLCSRSQSNPPT